MTGHATRDITSDDKAMAQLHNMILLSLHDHCFCYMIIAFAT